MRAVRRSSTKPEMELRRRLHAMGFRYRLNVPRLPGSPDLVFPRYRAAVFVHGCFWHRHDGCRRTTMPKTRTEFWSAKFGRNIQRDADVEQTLLAEGWRVGVVWECKLKKSVAGPTAALVAEWLKSNTATMSDPM